MESSGQKAKPEACDQRYLGPERALVPAPRAPLHVEMALMLEIFSSSSRSQMSVSYFADGETQVWESQWAVLGQVVALETGPRGAPYRAFSGYLGVSVPTSLDETACVPYAGACHGTWIKAYPCGGFFRTWKSCPIWLCVPRPNVVLALLVLLRHLEGERVNEWWVRSGWLDVSSVESPQLVVINII